MSFGLFLRFKPDFDIEAVYQGAIEWVQTGTFAKYYDYYYHFPNNLGAMTFLHFFFSIASFLGFEDYFLVGMIVNSILSILTMMVVSLILKHISGAKQAVFALVIFAVYLPFYFIAPVFYTDSLSMLFPVLFYYLYLKLKDTSYNKKFFLICILMGLAASIGMKIKFTVVIMVIAVAIDMFINSNWKKAISANAVVCSVILICFAVFNVYIYSYHLDRERARQDNDPYVHWVMMGLKGSGGYNPDDYLFTRSFKDPDERKAAIIQEIKRRISEYGPDGMFKFLTKKSVKCFGDGTFGLDDFLADREDKNVLHSFVISEGDKYELYRHICEAILFTLMLFMVLLALKYFFSKEKNIYLAPLVAVFGIFLFFVTLLLISKGYIFQTTVNTNLWLRIFIFLTTGAFTGFISGMMGVGGGAIMIPPMVILTHMPQQMAQGTSLLAMVPVGLIGAYTHYKLGNVEKSIAPGLVIGAALGGFFGGTVANLIPEFYLKLLFSMVLLWMSIRFIKIAR